MTVRQLAGWYCDGMLAWLTLPRLCHHGETWSQSSVAFGLGSMSGFRVSTIHMSACVAFHFLVLQLFSREYHFFVITENMKIWYDLFYKVYMCVCFCRYFSNKEDTHL